MSRHICLCKRVRIDIKSFYCGNLCLEVFKDIFNPGYKISYFNGFVVHLH